MRELFIKSSKAVVKVISEEKIIKNIMEEEFLYTYIPSVEIVDNSEVDKIVVIKKYKDNKIKISYNTITYFSKDINIKDVIAFIEYVLERIRQEKGIICIHGAGAIINDKLIVTWGTTTGMGKTSLALELAKDNLFYSDEKILIDLNTMKAVGRISKQYLSTNYWKSKYGDNSYYEHNNIAVDKKYDIAMFVQPIICNQDGYVLDEWTNDKFLWHLYEESSRKIRGTSRILFNNTYPVMSFDSESISLNRLKLLKKFTKKIHAYYFKGNVNKALEIINNKLK